MVKIELSLNAKNLKNVAGAFKGKSDPFAVVTQMATKPGETATVIGRTETIQNNTSPEWNRVFILDYAMGSPTKVAITLFDEGNKKGENRSMGAAVFEIGELLAARGGTKAKTISGGGTLYAAARQSQGSGILDFQLKAVKLMNTEGLLRKSDPFFEFSRKVDAAGGQTWDNVFRSDVVKDNLSPTWKMARIELSTLCGGNLDLPLRVKVFDYESSGKHVLMGEMETSVNGLVKAATSGSTMQLQKGGKDAGSIAVSKAQVTGIAAARSAPVAERMGNMSLSSSQPSFLDYLAGGCELNVAVAIDFTGSNGDPRKPGTLHYRHPDGSLNDYEKAVVAIVGILEKYDSDKKFPVLGYGAKYGGEVRHCFQCGSTEEVVGTAGVLQAYRDVFQSGLIMSRPTVITDVIHTAAERANKSLPAALARGRQTYTILLIITDGVVADLPATVACLDAVEDAPLSVVIVGVGSEDFTGMRQLDGDMKVRQGKRDIVQFVEFNKHSSSPTDLSSHTLEEIPSQVVGFFQRRGIPPGPPIPANEKEIVVGDEEEIDLSLVVEEDEIVVRSGGSAISKW